MKMLDRAKGTKQRWANRKARRDRVKKDLDDIRGGVATASSLDESVAEELLGRVRREGAVRAAAATSLEGLVEGPTGRPPLRHREGEELSRALLERILGDDDTLGARFLYAGADAARAVGRIVVRSSTGFRRGFGTGFLVAPGILMTNHHVLGTEAEAAPSIVQFGYYELPGGNHAAPLEFQLTPSRLFIADRALDFALIAVAARDLTSQLGIDQLGWHVIDKNPNKVMVGERLNLVQHPGGGPQRCALRDNALVDSLENFYHYKSDTERGSSGSPVFNDNWELVALHHSGVPKTDEQGRYLHVDGDGKLWDRHLHHIDELAFVANEGVRIERIRAFLSNRRDGLSQPRRTLLDRVLAAQPAEPLVERDVLSRVGGLADVNSAPVPSAPSGPTISVESDNTFSVPLRITVDNDKLVAVAVGAIDGGVDVNVADPVVPSPIEPIPDTNDPAPTSNTEWYDRAADETARATYYACNLLRRRSELGRALRASVEARAGHPRQSAVVFGGPSRPPLQVGRCA